MKKFNIKKIGIVLAIVLIVSTISFILGIQYTQKTILGEYQDSGASLEQLQKINFLKEYLNENYLIDVSEDELNIGQLKGMVAALDDPYSVYLTREEFDDLIEDTSGKFYGIGIYMSTVDGLLTVVSPIKDTPAEQAGILPGDIILEVDGQEIDGTMADKATKLIKGEKGTEVELTVLRSTDDSSKRLTFNVKRDEIHIDTVSHKDLGDTMYIQISQFNENTYDEFMDVLDLIDDRTKGILLDLRSNPGGVLSVCTDIADELLPEGLIVYTKSKGGIKDQEIHSDSQYLDLPIVTLINRGSASASEILAGALKDHNRTTIVGEKSFGKGVVQVLNKFSYGDGIKLTISEYFTPNGFSIEKKGIKPDIEVDLEDMTKPIGIDNLKEDAQLERGLEELTKQYR